MEGGNTKDGVWGYYGLNDNGKWLSEECKAVPDVCKKLKSAGYGTVGQVTLHTFALFKLSNQFYYESFQSH